MGSHTQPGHSTGHTVLPVETQTYRQTTMSAASRRMGPDPMTLVCSNCQANITTDTREEIGIVAWIAAGVMCVTGLWCCAPIPLFVDSLKDVTHVCPSCQALVGRYKAKL